MRRTANPSAVTMRTTQPRGDSFTSVLSPVVCAVVAIVLNFLLVVAFTYDRVAGAIAWPQL